MTKRLVRTITAIALSGAMGGSLFAADVDAPRYIEGAVTWTADNTYYLSGYHFVRTPSGAAEASILTIEPGTVIKARETESGGEASALVVTRGTMIHAEGTASSPIIFTSELDTLDGSLGIDDISLWGGVIILGHASINSRADGDIVSPPVEDQIEGMDVTGDEVALITFGGDGTMDDDSSGTFKYVSIRHGGYPIGTANEINGLTMGGVGSGTTIEYVEVFANKDDGFEWFGGTVNARYLVSAFGNDDGFDFDQGWRGNGQFWFVIQTESAEDKADKGGEHDGATKPLDAIPQGSTIVANATYIGIGPDGAANVALNLRDNAGVKYYNSVFTDYAQMIFIEDDNVDRFDAGDIVLQSSVWYSHIADNNNADGFNANPDPSTQLVDPTVFWTDMAYLNQIADPMLVSVSRTDDGMLDPRPAGNSPALDASKLSNLPENGWWVQTDYAGAFAPTGPTWMQGWTKLSSEGYLTEVPVGPAPGSMNNISNRGQVGTGEAVQIAGFSIPQSSGRTSVMVRAVGPGLADFGIQDPVSDPELFVYSSDDAITAIVTNDNWDATAANEAKVRDAEQNAGAFPLASGSLDAALVIELDPGIYTAIAAGVGGAEGIALVEVYILP